MAGAAAGAAGAAARPPANFTSAAMRFSIGGCVAKTLMKSECGFSMNISRTSDGAFTAALPEIFCSAEIIASGFLVSSTAPASARYSRFRESANRITIASA